MFEPAEGEDSPVVICTDLADEGARAAAEAVSELIAEVNSTHGFTAPVLWIEHYPPAPHSTSASDTFKLVHPGAFRIEEAVAGSKLVGIGTPERELLSTGDVESLLGHKL